MGHILAPTAIPPGGGLHQQARFVPQTDGQSIQFRFSGIDDFARLTQPFPDPAVKVNHLCIGESVFQRQHRHPMQHFAKAGEWLGTYPLGGRVRCNQIGKLLLQRLQLPHQPVIFAIRNLGIIQDIVAIVMQIELFAQLSRTL